MKYLRHSTSSDIIAGCDLPNLNPFIFDLKRWRISLTEKGLRMRMEQIDYRLKIVRMETN